MKLTMILLIADDCQLTLAMYLHTIFVWKVSFDSDVLFFYHINIFLKINQNYQNLRGQKVQRMRLWLPESFSIL